MLESMEDRLTRHGLASRTVAVADWPGGCVWVTSGPGRVAVFAQYGQGVGGDWWQWREWGGRSGWVVTCSGAGKPPLDFVYGAGYEDVMLRFVADWVDSYHGT